MPEKELLDVLDRFSLVTIRQHWVTLFEEIKGLPLKVHPLGFIHSVLCRKDGTSLRLHIWDSQSRVMQQPHWPIHTHIFDLRSIVILGSLTNHIYSWRGSQLDAVNRLYKATLENGESRLTATDSVGTCEHISSEVVNAGESYAVDRGMFHQTTVPETSFTATFARTTDDSGHPLVIGDMASKSLHIFQRSELGAEDKNRVLAELGGFLST